MTRKKLIQFGAGNIGRSFIAQVFSQAGFEVVFIDINEKIINELNNKGAYRVIIKKNREPDEEITVANVRAVNSRDKQRVIEEIAETELIATSVGQGALKAVIPLIAEGIYTKYKGYPQNPVDIIIAENIRDGSSFFQELLSAELPEDFPLPEYIGLVETSIGKMVPIMKDQDKEKDPVWVFAEPYNTLILDGKGFRNPVPPVPSLKAVENIKAYVDRKLFIHNLGHASAAYFGFQNDPSQIYIYQVLENSEVMKKTRNAMEEAAAALLKEYPEDFTEKDLEDHIEDLLTRFKNRSLGDTVFRVGRDLYRKLSKNDRLVGAMLLACRHNLPFPDIARALKASFAFKAADENGKLFPKDSSFINDELPKGTEHILQKVCGLSPKDPLENKVFRGILKTG